MSLLNFTTILISLSLNLFNTHESVEWKFFLYLILMNNIFNAGKLMVLEILLLKNFFWTDIQKAATINFVVRRLFIR